jgi:hypothetical protein
MQVGSYVPGGKYFLPRQPMFCERCPHVDEHRSQAGSERST